MVEFREDLSRIIRKKIVSRKKNSSPHYRRGFLASAIRLHLEAVVVKTGTRTTLPGLHGGCLGHDNVASLLALAAVDHFEGYFIAFVQSPKSVTLDSDGGVVHKNVFRFGSLGPVGGDEAVAFLGIKPLNNACWHITHFFYFFIDVPTPSLHRNRRCVSIAPTFGKKRTPDAGAREVAFLRENSNGNRCSVANIFKKSLEKTPLPGGGGAPQFLGEQRGQGETTSQTIISFSFPRTSIDDRARTQAVGD